MISWKSSLKNAAYVIGVASITAKLVLVASSTMVGVDAKSAEASEVHKRVMIGLDVSNTSQLVTNEKFAERAAAKLMQIVEGLTYRDEVVINLFGEYGKSDETYNMSFVISRKVSPQKLALELGQLVSSVAKLVEEKKISSHENTNILAYLNEMNTSYPCSQKPTAYVLVTDGLEFSVIANSYELIKSAGKTFPAPDMNSYQGCSITMLGIGGDDVDDPILVERLRRMWSGWLTVAGFDGISLLRTW